MQKISDVFDGTKNRVNTVLYDASLLDIVQVTESGQEWIEQYFKNGCPENMKRVVDIEQIVFYLLDDSSKIVTNSLITTKY